MASPHQKHGIGAFVSWLPYHGRSQGYIDALALVPIYVHYLRERIPVLAPLKYGPMTVATLIALYRSRARVVFAMNPPVLTPLVVYLYCLHTGARFFVDCHSGVFESPKWRWAMPIQKFLARRAEAVIVTNTVHAKIVSSWGARPLIIGDPPINIPSMPGDAIPSQVVDDGQPFVFVINRFNKDEAVEAVLDAARRVPNARFYISGDPRRAEPAWLSDHAPNVTFTGWLTTEEFWYFARHAEAVLTLTTQENTILRGGWEAMYLGQPLITSNTRALQTYFTSGAVFVPNTGDGIAAGVGEALKQTNTLRVQMREFRDAKYRQWAEDRAQLEHLLNLRFDAPALQVHMEPDQPATMVEAS